MAKIKGTAYVSDDDAADLISGKSGGQPIVKEQKKTAGKANPTLDVLKRVAQALEMDLNITLSENK